MNYHKKKFADASELRKKLTLSIGLVTLVVVTPFSINNFIHGRYLLGVVSSFIVVILCCNAWSIMQGRYYPRLTSLGLVPIIIFYLNFVIQQQQIFGYLWCYPASIMFYFLLPERQAWVANTFLLIMALSQAWNVLEHPVAARVAATLLMVSIFSVIFVRVITEQQHKLEKLAVTDPLTGLLNRTLLRSTLEEAIHQNNRTGVSMTLLTLDLDRFKSINDTLGHDAGDVVLQGVSELLKKRTRRTDKVFRPGGEEFLVLLYGTEIENGVKVAEELRGAIALLSLLSDRTVTVSIGVATLLAGESWTEWLKRSDENLYRAKSGGRNRVVG